MVQQASFLKDSPPGGLSDLTLVEDLTDNDSNKIISIPANTRYKLLSLYVEYEASSTTGNRNVEVRFRNSDNEVFLDIRMNPAITAGSFRRLNFYPGAGNTFDQFEGGSGYMSMSSLIMPGGCDIHILDTGAIDVSSDKMLIYLLVQEWTV